jgi:putative SOS response-associated peptidase YedK
MPYKNKADRKYENATKYQASPEQKKNRAARNAARAKLMKEGKVSKGDGKDVSHKVAFDKGGSNKQGVRVESASTNRSFKRDSKRNLVSETSKRERKK